MPEFAPITEAAMRTLPRWARVAFAAKCGRRIQPLLHRSWSDPSPKVLRAFEHAVALAEQSASQGKSSDGLDAAIDEAAS